MRAADQRIYGATARRAMRLQAALDEAVAERDRLREENQRLRDVYENAVGNRERFGWTINHLLECEEALRTVEAVASEQIGEARP